MSAIETSIPTENGSKYLQQLCKHWSHRFAETTFSPTEGRVPFDESSVCELRAEPDALHVRVETTDDQSAHKLGEVVIDHLKRFAFREELRWVWREA